MKKINPIRQLGYTLVELTIGLAVVALVIATVLAGVRGLMESYNFNRTVTQISGAIEKINQVSVRDTDASFLTTFNLTRPGYNVFREFQLTGGNAASGAAPTVTAANGVTVSLANSWSGWTAPPSTRHYRLMIWDVNPGVCGDLAAMLQDYADQIVIRGTDWSETVVKSPNLPFDSGRVRGTCSNGKLAALFIDVLIGQVK